MLPDVILYSSAIVGAPIMVLGVLAAWLRIGDYLWMLILGQLGWRKDFFAFMWHRAEERKRRDEQKEAPDA